MWLRSYEVWKKIYWDSDTRHDGYLPHVNDVSEKYNQMGRICKNIPVSLVIRDLALCVFQYNAI